MSGKIDIKKNKGFTLVELIVVLVILAILLIGSIDLDKTENNIRQSKAEVSTSAQFKNNF